MSASTAIGLISKSLRNLLIKEMRLTPAVNVTILAPDETGGDRRLNLFLYKIQENPFLKNMDWQAKPGKPAILIPPPLSLNLFYLMTSYAQNDPQTGNSTAHEILGEAMRVFYEVPVVSGKYLEPGLTDAREQIKIMQNTVDLDELSRVWSTFTQPFRLSVLYEISVAQLDMLPESERMMAERVKKIGLQTQTPYRPPLVETLNPLNGPAGSVLQFRGRDLKGQQAAVHVMGKCILKSPPLNNDFFQASLPTDLLPGFYEIRVEISDLFRRIFFFEVSA